MRYVVKYGTGKQAEVTGYRVGGKTATSEKLIGGAYKEKAKFTSFVAAFPIDKPRYVVYVLLDAPRSESAERVILTGGTVAAPVVGQIISRMAPLYGLAPSYEVTDEEEDRIWLAGKKSVPVKPLSPVAGGVHAVSY